MTGKIFIYGTTVMLVIFGMTVFGCNPNPTDYNDSIDGIFTLSNIPAKFNGKYAILSVSIFCSSSTSPEEGIKYVTINKDPQLDEELFVFGAQNFNIDSFPITYTGVRISDGSVNIPMWVIVSDFPSLEGIERYYGNDDFYSIFYTYDNMFHQFDNRICITIYNSPTITSYEFWQGIIPDGIRFKVKFKNGGAKKSWNDGIYD